jgi:L-fuculose-phosphate aldolase
MNYDTVSGSLKSEIIFIAKLLHQKNFLASADGNISVRVDKDTILITPSGKHKAFIKEDDLALVTLDNHILHGNPSGERLMHLEVYRNCKEAQAVVHAHPPYAIAWSVAFPELTELPNECLSELILAVGQVPIVPYARPGSLDMGKVLLPWLPNQRVFILSRHGALSWGQDLQEAYNGIERLEHTAYILSLAKQMNNLSFLPPDEIKALKEMRLKLGHRTF